ncbi:hypothetical protein L1049_028496 [Liquidambar formosana]|uniref:Uncharacterized protein n=1 Tax=Liquidambar formosana TaxID=63359 RepID=A0AAP0RL27_LIQFO
MVNQSAALNRAGAENMKPRQLSDAIHEEVRNKIMSRISDGVWEIIRSDDGMKSEITETVQSVYNKVVNPKGKEECESSSPNNVMLVQKEVVNNVSLTVSASEMDDRLSDSEPKEPPGFSMYDHNQNNCEEQHKEEPELPMPDERCPPKNRRIGPTTQRMCCSKMYVSVIHLAFQSWSTSTHVMIVMRTLMCLQVLVDELSGNLFCDSRSYHATITIGRTIQ